MELCKAPNLQVRTKHDQQVGKVRWWHYNAEHVESVEGASPHPGQEEHWSTDDGCSHIEAVFPPTRQTRDLEGLGTKSPGIRCLRTRIVSREYTILCCSRNQAGAGLAAQSMAFDNKFDRHA
ncbi:hypothetical protein PPTG_24179 [Phytophthora nicotianae INRA-310]|uniref:Uncharacterized protein n=1 Tax=Phytophthora nicotianae (strain INRA-310) TaxID=761204 RepID=W2PKP9_PHYN3|nr:hypothetical protein PPTG_24179 [Phytophthora nicotianae INRA-310]ETN00799.1 hypothetical protein PPTG_24179 [Phytophthora nicotianae INRA-310]